jgi:hypothetical protein
VPHIASLDDPSSLVNITSMSLVPRKSSSSGKKSALGIDAQVTLVNPLVDVPALAGLQLDFDVPWHLSFGVYLPYPQDTEIDNNKYNDILLARASLSLFHYSIGQPAFNLSLRGIVDHLNSSDPDSPLSKALATFIKRFIATQSNRVIVQPFGGPPLPSFLSSLLERARIPLSFPGTKDPKQLLTNVHIQGMKVVPVAGELRCSGTVMGELDLPREMQGLEASLDVMQIKPDIFVYDGRPGDVSPKSASDYPPRPVPANAFARVRPVKPLPANTTRVFDKERNKTISVVSARIESTPLEILEGRGDVFRRFVAFWTGPTRKAREY